MRLRWMVLVPGVLWATPLGAQVPATFNACYVPQVGAMYLINLPGLPAACLSSNHTPISWTDGIPDGAVTIDKLADNSVGSPQLVNGSVTTGKLAATAEARVRDYQVVHSTFNQSGGAGSPVVACPSGTRPIGGGALKASNAVLHGDHPVVPPEYAFNGWAFYFGPTSNGAAATNQLFVVCVAAP
jgi:hypothetical protein